jgi:hypothetical protein
MFENNNFFSLKTFLYLLQFIINIGDIKATSSSLNYFNSNDSFKKIEVLNDALSSFSSLQTTLTASLDEFEHLTISETELVSFFFKFLFNQQILFKIF